MDKKTVQSTILLVDDQSSIRRSFNLILESVGYKILQAENGKQGLDILGKEDVDLVLLDLDMPVMTGIEMLAKMKRTGMLEKTAVVVVTGNETIENSFKSINFGAKSFVAKPVDRDPLLKIVAHALFLQRNAIRSRAEEGRVLEQNQTILNTGGVNLTFRLQVKHNCEITQNIIYQVFSQCARFVGYKYDSNAILHILNELIPNTINYGALGINSSLRDMDDSKFHDACESAIEKYGDRNIEVNIRAGSGAVALSISDFGKGFDWVGFLKDFDISKAESHGRGIFMIRLIAGNDNVSWNKKGNTITIIFPF